MRALILALPIIALATAAMAEPEHPELASIAKAVDPEALHATIAHLVAFGTRHTLSDTTSPPRGLGAACGGCLEVVTPEQTFTGARIPNPAVVQDVIAIQHGLTDANRVVIISGHIDSRVTDPLDATHDAPGANDDGSGTAAVLEAARILSRHKFHATVVYAVLSGEEQGLYGGQVLAAYAKAQGWRVEAVLNNDIVGNTHGMDGKTVDDEVRVFSEGVRAAETPAEAAIRRRSGGEMDSASRNLARFMHGIAEQYVPGFRVRMILRSDRFSRGGDQLPMQDAGYPAVRLTEADENYTRQHQDVRQEGGIAYGDVIEGVDFAYLAKVTRLNAVTLAALALAPAPPEGVKLAGAVTADTTVSWTPVPGAARYRVWWRETTDAKWNEGQSRTTPDATLKLTGINIDDYTFGVSALSDEGYESPVEFPGPTGAFFHEPAVRP